MLIHTMMLPATAARPTRVRATMRNRQVTIPLPQDLHGVDVFAQAAAVLLTRQGVTASDVRSATHSGTLTGYRFAVSLVE